MQADIARQRPHDQGADRGAAAVDHAVEAHHPAAQPGVDGVLQQGLLPRPDDDHGEPGDRQAGQRQPEDVGGGEADQHRREERDAGNRGRGQAGDGAPLGQPEPAQHGAQPGRGGQPGEPLGAAPEHRVGEAGEQLHEGPRADRDDGQDDEHRPDPLVAGGIGVAIGDFARHVADPARQRPLLPVFEADTRQHGEEDDEGGGVEGERPADAVAEDQEPGDHRPDKARAVEDQRVDPDRRRQILARDQARDDGEAHRLAEGEHGAPESHQDQQDLDGDRARERKAGEQDRLDQVEGLDRPEGAQALHPFGDHAGDRRQQDGRKQIGEGDDAEPRPRMGEIPGEPADRHPLHPGADMRGHVAAREQAEVAMRERAPNRLEAGGKLHERVFARERGR